MQKAVFIDKDGTLVKDIPYNVDPNLIVFEINIIKGLTELQQHGYKLIIVSNQSGVAFGHFTEDALVVVRNKIEGMLAEYGIRLDGFYYCPHHPEGTVGRYRVDCDNRKPAPGMLLAAARDFDLDLAECWMIGDILHDVEAGNRAGCKTVLVDNGNETEWKWNKDNQPDFTAKSIDEAARLILDSKQEYEH